MITASQRHRWKTLRAYNVYDGFLLIDVMVPLLR
jgi:hypothetical protein